MAHEEERGYKNPRQQASKFLLPQNKVGKKHNSGLALLNTVNLKHILSLKALF